MTVYVVMGNDYPDSVWSTNELAEQAIAQSKRSDKVTYGWSKDHPGIYYRVYTFNLDNKE